MDSFLSSISIILLLWGVGHAALSPQQIYWQSVLPHIPMPTAISDLLPGVGKHIESMHVNHANGKLGPFFYNYNKDVKRAGDSQKHMHSDPSVAIFFLEKDIYPGAEVKFFSNRASLPTPFIPRQKADNMPFSSSKIPQILEQFSIKPESEEAISINKVIEECETPALDGENKHCATSLESMVEFSMSVLGTNRVQVSSTSANKVDKAPQNYTMTAARLEKNGNILVSCHLGDYPYAVFYCHSITETKAFTIDMIGDDGNEVKALAMCHANTKDWDPEHVSFKVLKVKPGTEPICHFMPLDSVLWSRETGSF